MHLLLFTDVKWLSSFLLADCNNNLDYCGDNVLPIKNCLNSHVENILTDFKDFEFWLA